MHFLYALFQIIIGYGLRLFFGKVKMVNSPKQLFGRTIYVSNHAASFLDPLLISSYGLPIVFFMTRSDVFTKYTSALLRGVHMLPIYRQLDGQDTKRLNEAVFKKCSRILKHGRNLLLFGEGFTDDVFIRRLKPVKKGAVRIGFTSLEENNWNKKIYIAAVGCNYEEPNLLRSKVVLSYSDKICLNDYKEEYLENPNKVITVVTKLIEKLMQEQLTHVQDAKIAPLHEQFMSITRKGMNPHAVDSSIPLLKRWEYSKHLAAWFNEQNFEGDEYLKTLKDETESYFKLIKKLKIEDSYVYWKQQNGTKSIDLLKLIILSPFALLGFIHLALPYVLLKRFVEKTFKRKVFWSSVKLVLGVFAMGLINLPYIFLFHAFIFPSWWLSIAYFVFIGVIGVITHNWMNTLKRYKTKGVVNKMDISKLIQKRIELNTKIEAIIEIN